MTYQCKCRRSRRSGSAYGTARAAFVRSDGQPTVPLKRRIAQARGGGSFTLPDGTEWDEVETPSAYRSHTTQETGPLLHLDEEEALSCCDRLLTDPATGTRALHRTSIPLEVADATPHLAESPDQQPVAIYGLLAEAGHKMTWSETVRARMPLPDERTALKLPDATPLLHLARITHGTDDRPCCSKSFA
ncbi:UTRA domain-containing protein [Streptomyces sp. NPDC047071]|uniref:UTRA domain-containing protein n=1 Tax=Streptomyces sp. NPDC047071 TaxID=3154808 RepID=UPI0034539FFB